MSSPSTDLILNAERIERATRERTSMQAQEITDPENSKYDYACGDCLTRGHQLRLKFVKASERRVTFKQWDKNTGQLRDGSMREKHYRLPAHFDRWPDAGEHKCEQPARYAALRGFGMRMNARTVGANQLIFPMLLPGKRLHHETEARQNDLRSATRPEGLGLAGMEHAKDFVRLFEFFKKDPGLQSLQYFHDGLSLRSISETYFEKPARLYNYLRLKDAVGKEASIIVAYLLDPNTSQQAINDPGARGGFIDRSMPLLEGGGKLKLFVRGANADSIEALKETALRNNRYMAALTLVYGEAYLSKDRPHHVEVEIFDRQQVIASDAPFLLNPAKKLAATREMTASKQASFGL